MSDEIKWTPIGPSEKDRIFSEWQDHLQKTMWKGWLPNGTSGPLIPHNILKKMQGKSEFVNSIMKAREVQASGSRGYSLVPKEMAMPKWRVWKGDKSTVVEHENRAEAAAIGERELGIASCTAEIEQIREEATPRLRDSKDFWEGSNWAPETVRDPDPYLNVKQWAPTPAGGAVLTKAQLDALTKALEAGRYKAAPQPVDPLKVIRDRLVATLAPLGATDINVRPTPGVPGDFTVTLNVKLRPALRFYPLQLPAMVPIGGGPSSPPLHNPYNPYNPYNLKEPAGKDRWTPPDIDPDPAPGRKTFAEKMAAWHEIAPTEPPVSPPGLWESTKGMPVGDIRILGGEPNHHTYNKRDVEASMGFYVDQAGSQVHSLTRCPCREIEIPEKEVK